MKKIIVYILPLVLLLHVSKAQTPRPADPQSEPIALLHATAHIGNGQVIANSYILFEKGKIVGIGDATNSRPDLTGYRLIDAAGKHVYPGLIMPSSRLGLEDISAVRPTVDFNEVGEITPHVRSQIAFNTDSDLLPTFRFNGILLAQVAPQGGLVTGTSSVMMLDGWNWEDATYVQDDAIHVSWPSRTISPRWWMGETERKENPTYQKQCDAIGQLFIDAAAYHAGTSKVDINLVLEAVAGVLDGTQKVFVEVNNAREIMDAINRFKSVGVTNLVIVGGSDAYYVKDLLRQNNIPVILDNLHRLPSREDEAVDEPFRLPYLLTKEGILVGLRHEGMLARGRNLPFYAGTAAAYGLEKEEALKLITSNTAKILGIDRVTGTLETGKDANLLLTEGDLLDMKESIIISAFIQGREVIIEGKQQILYERFKDKYSE